MPKPTTFIIIFLVIFIWVKGEDSLVITDDAIRKNFGSSSAILQVSTKEPELDGKLNEDVWNTIKKIWLRFADQRVEGIPVEPASVRMFVTGNSVFFGFDVSAISPKAEVKLENPKSLGNSYIGVTWKIENSCFLFLFNEKGVVYHARRNSPDKEWNVKWTPSEFEVKVAKRDAGWTAELRLPLELFKNEAKQLPKLWRVDFLQRPGVPLNRLWYERKEPLKDLQLIRNLFAWKSRNLQDCERLVHLDVSKDDDFGILYYPLGDLELTKDQSNRLKNSTQEEVSKIATQGKEKNIRLPGFDFSEVEMEYFYPNTPILFVPLTTKPPVIDGESSDESWQLAPIANLGFLSSLIGGSIERNRTFVRLLCDSQNLYALFECEEEYLGQVISTPGLIDRGELWKEDTCNLLFDVGQTRDVDSAGYIDLLFNVAGSVDHIRRRSDTSWDPPSLEIRTRRNEVNKSWTAEVKIAFKDMNIDASSIPKVWGANFLRSRTHSRGKWIDRDQIVDPAYFHFDFAWRGNVDASPHRPELFGVLYLQTGNALPQSMYETLVKRGDASIKNLKVFRPTEETPKAIVSQVKPKVAFVNKPLIQIKEKSAEIHFSLVAPCDVEVSIKDSSGKIVRHLVAGLLGVHAPPPLKANTLNQVLEWDLCDDRGIRLPAGSYTAQVAAGLKVDLEQYLLWNPNGLMNVIGIATDLKGNIYILQQEGTGWYGVPYLLVFDRNGNYQRQIYPASNNLASEKLVGAKGIELADGNRIPAVFHSMVSSLLPEMGDFSPQRFAIDSNLNKIILVNGMKNTEDLFNKRLLRIGTDGSIMTDYLGPVIGPDAHMAGPSSTVLSPDGQYAYMTGFRGGKSAFEDKSFLHQTVYRVNMKMEGPEVRNAQGFVEPFLGEFRRGGVSDKLLNDPQGLAIDAEGNLYVADFGNNRIAIFKPDGTFKGERKVLSPKQIEVNFNTGAMYVLSLESEKSVLRKYDTLLGENPSAILEFPHWQWARMAIDFSKPLARLWIVVNLASDKTLGGREVLTIDETEKGLENKGTMIGDLNYPMMELRFGLAPFSSLKIDPDGNKVIVRNKALDTKNSKRLNESEAVVNRRGLDGLMYQWQWKENSLRRFDELGKELPFAAIADGALYPTKKAVFAFDVGPTGRIYIFHKTGVDIYATDGSLEKKDFIVIPEAPVNSNGVVGNICVTWDGSVYLGVSMKEIGKEYPDVFAGRFPITEQKPSLPYVYRHLYGSIVKFGPNGGSVILDKQGKQAWCSAFKGNQNCRSEGVEWLHLGISPIRYRDVGHLPCNCETAKFDVDGFGRVFLPDALRFSVEALDSKGNSLLRFGRYGNMDDGLPKINKRIEPAFAWPVAVAVRKNIVFVTDVLNKRVAKLLLTHDITEILTFDVP